MSSDNQTPNTLRTLAYVLAIMCNIGVSLAAVILAIYAMMFASLSSSLGIIDVYTGITAGTLWILAVVCLVPLAWMIPMTIMIKKSRYDNEPHMALSICSLFFLGLLAGVFMLVSMSSTNKDGGSSNSSKKGNSDVEALEKYAALYKSKAITKAEYEAKKKQILG
ncbi:MAG: hypothetical protein Ta2E_05170 [Mycoplasmoidaceae bacterium]|nr:MAG: hypothetical protein Ta2E_05170 [Mycoplasmoidaceae bacterium]